MPYYNKTKFQKSSNYSDAYGKDRANGVPTEGEPQIGLSTKAMKGLPKSAYAVLADPYEAVLPTGRPYPVLTAFNKRVGGTYSGDQNIDGGNVVQYPNSNQSKLLYLTDFMRLKININYRYRAMKLSSLPSDEGPDDVYVTSGLIDQARSAIAEAVSVLQTTTFTQMAIQDYRIETDLPMGSAPREEWTDGDGNTHYFYTDLTDVIYASLTYYQLVLQETTNMINWINSFRLKQGTMIARSWNREVATLNSIFSMYNKKAFLGLLDGICLQLPGDYIDTEWVKQMNMINSMPSARSDSMFDPVLELQTRCAHPGTFKMWIRTSEDNYSLIYDDAQDLLKKCDRNIVPPEQQENPKKLFWDAIDDVMDLMSAENTMLWARNNDQNSDSANSRFNLTKWNLDVITLCLTTFKTKFNDIRDCLDTLARTGLNTWSKGFRPSITKDTDAPMFHNSIVEDIYKTVMSGANDLIYNEATKRWRFFSLWNMYNGIPEYDAKVGGCFISMSAKDLNIDTDSDNTRAYLPIAFFTSENQFVEESEVKLWATTRLGHNIAITTETVTISQTPGLNRLVPLSSQTGLQMRVPMLDADHSGTVEKPITTPIKCLLDKTLLQIFGVTRSTENGNNYLVDNDIIAVYQIEIKDITNDAIAYARLTGPFKGAVSEHDEIGFARFGQ